MMTLVIRTVLRVNALSGIDLQTAHIASIGFLSEHVIIRFKELMLDVVHQRSEGFQHQLSC